MIIEKAEILIKKLMTRGETLAVAESCTGGMLASWLTDVEGASQVFLGGVVAYSNQIKRRILDVKISTMENFGAVSAECAVEMSQGVLHNLASDYSISITGIAGPGGFTADKPVGLVYIAIGKKDIIQAYEFHFYGNRSEIRRQSAIQAIDLLLEILG